MRCQATGGPAELAYETSLYVCRTAHGCVGGKNEVVLALSKLAGIYVGERSELSVMPIAYALIKESQANRTQRSFCLRY